MRNGKSIILENDKFRLVLSSECVAESLVLKSSNTECICKEASLPFFSLTEDRPFNNEIKLAHPTCRMTFDANRIREKNGRLIVGFDTVDFEAVIDVRIASSYIGFELSDFIVRPDSFGLGVVPIIPPVAEFNLVQIPTPEREHFGEWLNVTWDNEVAVNILSTSPYSYVSSDKQSNCRRMFGRTLRDVKLKGAGIALIVSETNNLFDAIDAVEKDYGLPRGVESRRSPFLNRSYYWSNGITPKTVDKHIEYAKKGGFKFMSFYYSCILKEIGEYKSVGEYGSYREEYPNGKEDLIKMLEKVKAAGIIPGLHVLHTHIGLRTHYLTPKADPRLNLVRHFTLARPLSKDDAVIYVEECPEGAPLYEKMRVLAFMGELIQYDSFSAERPYCFRGCKRGFNDTGVREHEAGTIGGILDVSEFCANSAYINQKTSLQDEIADGIAELYNTGFEFIYFDGSEGTSPPFDVNVGLAQWRVYKKLLNTPIFCEGAAKSHFSWHMLSGGNAFDAWSPDCFKEMVAKHPFAEAPIIKKDFTRLNFGWWKHMEGQRADVLEYGTALAAAWDCPGAFLASLDRLNRIPRTDDILETLRRWEDARATGFVTEEIKERLKDTEQEHTLLIDENGKYELVDCKHIKDAFGGDNRATVFVFERKNTACAVCWHNTGGCEITLPLSAKQVKYVSDFGKDEIPMVRTKDGLVLPIAEKRYLITDATPEVLINAFRKASLH